MITEANQSDAMESAIGSVNRALANYLESQSSLWNSYVDPREAWIDETGEVWESVGGGVSPIEELPYRNCTELFQVQSIARILARSNEFARNAHQNRINYIVGWGHTYTIQGVAEHIPNATIGRVQAVLDSILKANRWQCRQQEMLLRADRDGEVFIRTFRSDDGILRFRFIEPRQVQPPGTASDDQSFGVENKPGDIETVVAYHVDGTPIDAREIQHRKYNVDSSIKRGYPLLFPVRRNLVRAAKLLRNMSTATEIQTAIALIRKHQQATKEAVRSFIAAKAEQRPAGTTPENVLRYPSGSILDVPQGQEYTIPPQLDPSKTVSALQAELRAIASYLVMPEFMLSSDASNANYASTMVAEGPSVKAFESAQQTEIAHDTELLNAALDFAAESGLITTDERRAVRISVEPPSVQVRDRLKEAQTRQIDMGLGILSPQTATAETGRDYDQEQLNIELHQEKTGSVPDVNLPSAPSTAE